MKTLAIILILATIGLSAFALSRFWEIYFGTANISKTVSELTRFNKSAEVRSIQKFLEKLSSSRNVAPILDIDGQSIVFYNDTDGYIYRLNALDNFKKTQIAQLVSYLKDIVWSADRKRLIAFNGTNYVYFNLSTNKSVDIPDIKSPAFSPSGLKLAVLRLNAVGGGGELGLSDPEFTSFRKILSIQDSAWDIFWLSENIVSLDHQIGSRHDLFVLNTVSGDLVKILSEVNDLTAIWPSPDTLLYFSDEQTSGSTLFYRSKGGWRSFLLPFFTDANRCAWDNESDELYCAGQFKQKVGESFFRIQLTQPNAIHRLKMETGEMIRTDKSWLSADKAHLYFRNNYNGGLYRLKIEVIPEAIDQLPSAI